MTSRHIRRALGCAVVWAMFAGNGPAQTKEPAAGGAMRASFSILGSVLDPSEALISGASVTLMSGTRKVLQTVTDVKGEFRFDAVRSGHYELQVDYSGFKSQRTRVNL